MSRILIFDTETTGLPMRDAAYDHSRQPRLAQFAAILFDANRREVASTSFVVDAGIAIPAEASKVHGITTEVAQQIGLPESAAVGMFLRLVAQCDVIVAHNVDFDLLMMNIACARAKARPPIASKLVRCTMQESAPIINLPPTERMVAAGYGHKPKSPKLEEAYAFFFGEKLEGAHDALVDVRACGRVYWELVARGCWQEAA